MKIFTLLIFLIAVCSAQVPVNIVNKIQSIANKKLGELQQVDARTAIVEDKMDKLLEKARREKFVHEVTTMKKIKAKAEKMVDDYTKSQEKMIDKHFENYERNSNQTMQLKKKLFDYQHMNYHAQVKLLKFLKEQVKKETAALDVKRRQMEESRLKERSELMKALRALRVARMNGVKARAEAERRRHVLLKKAAEEERAAAKAEVEERKKMIASYKQKINSLEQHEAIERNRLRKVRAEIKRKAALDREKARQALIKKYYEEKKQRLAREKRQQFERQLFAIRCAAHHNKKSGCRR